MKIVSLLPSGTELVGALGLRDALVGVSHECNGISGVIRRQDTENTNVSAEIIF
jgi:iron complex transport system substrate-binding protein